MPMYGSTRTKRQTPARRAPRPGGSSTNLDPKAKLAAGKKVRPGTSMLRPSNGMR